MLSCSQLLKASWAIVIWVFHLASNSQERSQKVMFQCLNDYWQKYQAYYLIIIAIFLTFTAAVAVSKARLKIKKHSCTFKTAILQWSFLLLYMQQKSVFLFCVTGVPKQWVVPCLLRATPVLVPSPVLPSLCTPGALPSSLSNHSSQPRDAATHKKELQINSKKRRERRRGGKTPWKLGWSRNRKRVTESTQTATSWLEETLFSGLGKGVRASSQGCSSWFETSWAQRLRTGKMPPTFPRFKGNAFLLF